MIASSSHDSRLAREAEHFDRVYQEEMATNLLLTESDKRRYASPPGDTPFSREFYYHLLAPLRGKKVLEIACGGGLDTCLAAFFGAEVYAYDVSSAAVELTRKRAAVNGLSDRVHVEVCGDLEQAFAGETFDAVMGFAAVHHLPREALGGKILARLKSGGVAVFVEPVINSRLQDSIRKRIPYRFTEPTEDEEPLNDAVIAALAEPFSRARRREFEFVSRVYPLFASHRSLVRALHWMDSRLLSIKPLRRFASVVVFGLYREA